MVYVSCVCLVLDGCYTHMQGEYEFPELFPEITKDLVHNLLVRMLHVQLASSDVFLTLKILV